jgi:hypothetical protein
LFERALSGLHTRPWGIWVLAVVVCSPALFGGIELDDLHHQAMASNGLDLVSAAFTFVTDADRPQHLAAVDLPWWTSPTYKMDLWRPVAALTHFVDWSLWPRSALMMHLHSLLWYAALVGVVGLLHRGSDPSRRATLATVVFALSQAHGMNVGWLAARNSLIGATLGGLAFWAYRRGRDRQEVVARILGPGLLALAVLANEGAVGIFGYVLAHAVLLDRRRGRLLALLPYVAVIFVWRHASAVLGHGSAGGGLYLDPLANPLEYIGRTAIHGMILVAGRFGVAVVDPLGAIPGAYTFAMLAAVPFVIAIAWLLSDRLRGDRVLAAWGLGMIFSLATAGALVPTDRGMLVMGFGASVLLADLVLEGRRSGASRTRRLVAVTLIGIHLVVSPLLLALRVRSSSLVQTFVEPIEAALPRDPEVAERAVVILNVPSDLVMIYSRVMRQLAGEPAPARIAYLYAGTSPLKLQRPASDVLVLRPETPWLHAPLDRMFAEGRFVEGQRIEGPCFDALVEETNEGGLATQVRFVLHGRGRGCEPVFMAWDRDAPRSIDLPAVGRSIELPAARTRG